MEVSTIIPPYHFRYWSVTPNLNSGNTSKVKFPRPSEFPIFIDYFGTITPPFNVVGGKKSGALVPPTPVANWVKLVLCDGCGCCIGR